MILKSRVSTVFANGLEIQFSANSLTKHVAIVAETQKITMSETACKFP